MANKRGRPPGPKAKSPDEPQGEGVVPVLANYRGKRTVQFNLMHKIREQGLSDLVLESFKIILAGSTPVWTKDDRFEHGYRVEPDPNPLLPSTTLEQRLGVMKELLNRGEGLPVQSVQIDAVLKAQVENGVPPHLLDKPNFAAIFEIQKVFKKLQDGNTEDAEFTMQAPDQTPSELQEPCQVTEPANSELQELGQPKVELNENSVPGDDPSTL
jgi:hypothetical protein